MSNKKQWASLSLDKTELAKVSIIIAKSDSYLGGVSQQRQVVEKLPAKV